MLKFAIKISDVDGEKCSVKLENPKKTEYEKAKQSEQKCSLIVQQKIIKALEDLQNEK